MYYLMISAGGGCTDFAALWVSILNKADFVCCRQFLSQCHKMPEKSWTDRLTVRTSAVSKLTSRSRYTSTRMVKTVVYQFKAPSLCRDNPTESFYMTVSCRSMKHRSSFCSVIWFQGPKLQFKQITEHNRRGRVVEHSLKLSLERFGFPLRI